MIFILVSAYEEAAPLIEKFKLKKDMNAKPLEIFRWEETVLCISGEGAANHSAAVGYLAGRYGITREAGYRFLFLHPGNGYRLPHTLQSSKDGAAVNFYPGPVKHSPFTSGVLQSEEAAAAFESASRFFTLDNIIAAEVPSGYSAGIAAGLLTAEPSPPYSRVYVEEAAYGYPLTQTVLSRLPKAEIVTVKHYKDIFNRPGQNFAAQKRSPNLILAVREKNFVFPGAAVCDNFGHQRFFYTTQMMNCPYDCDYCYLRGMYPSANIVAFVNTGDYFAGVREVTGGNLGEPAYLSVSYDSDLLSLEPLFGFANGWINFARDNPRLTVEIRTKSAPVNSLPPLPAENIILSWTISPKGTARYEKNATSSRSRMEAAKAALDKGWRVRLCIDPVLPIGEWEKELAELLSEIRGVFGDISKLEGVSAGGFRMSKTYFKRIKKKGSPLLDALPLVEQDGVMRMAAGDEEKIIKLAEEYVNAKNNVQ